MKIAIDFTYVKNRPYSGTFQMGVAILECLHKAGAEYIALVCGQEDYKYMFEQEYCVELIKLPHNRILRNFARITYFLRNFNKYIDIIYVGSFNPIFWLKKGTVLIHDFYIIDIPHAYDWLQRIYYKMIVMNSIRFTDNCIVTTEVNLKRLYKYFPRVKNVYLYCLDNDFKIVTNSKAHKVKPLEILFVLTSSPNKRWEILFEQASKLTQHEPNKYVFHLVSPQKDFFKNIIDTRYIDLPIKYHQNLTKNEMMKLYQKVDIFWSASIIEGFGMPVRLATLANTYVIAPDTDINRESSLGLGNYYNVEGGDAHASITTMLMNNKEYDEQDIRLDEAIKYIKSVNSKFISAYLGNNKIKVR